MNFLNSPKLIIHSLGLLIITPKEVGHTMKFRHLLTAAIMAVSTLVTFSANSVEIDPDSAVKTKLANLGLQVSKVTDSPVAGLKQVMTNRGLFYVSSDGKFIVNGRIFDIDNGMKNVTDLAMGEERLKGIEKFKDSMIVFPAKNEKHRVTVFTDTTCGYCKKLHNQMDEYNELGITVQYLAFPRGGLYSDSFNKLMDVWCSKDQQTAMDFAKTDKSIEQANCNAPIAGHYSLGQASGVTGTPAIILNDGTMVGGYRPPSALLQTLEN